MLWVGFERILETPLPSLQPDIFLKGSLKSQNVSSDLVFVTFSNKIDVGLDVVDLCVRDKLLEQHLGAFVDVLAAVFHQVLNLVVLLSRQNDVTANQNLKDDHADAVLVLHDVGVVLESVHLEGGELIWRVQHVNLRLLETLLDGKEDVPKTIF